MQRAFGQQTVLFCISLFTLTVSPDWRMAL